ncbi:hypothetical protein B9Z55_006171 [Caenorhabditis nigoni]|uniref:Uncharacterized protein n=1 Tax=Caenorhabditis nigoni TaxID=1611254 RepID=A0A2G5V420_9PELO|nr:hypothetical protein B9Z55_006171 [Caenorhabditis nigoni]
MKPEDAVVEPHSQSPRTTTETSKAQLQMDGYAKRTTTRSDHAHVQRQKELLIVGQVQSTGKRESVTAREQDRSLILSAELELMRNNHWRTSNVLPQKCQSTEDVQTNKSFDVRRSPEVRPNQTHNYRSRSLEDVSSQGVSQRQKDATCHYNDVFNNRSHVQRTHSCVGDSSCTIQEVHLDGVTEGVRVRKESSVHKANEHEVDEEGHPLKLANTDVIQERQPFKTAQERKVLTGMFTGARAINESPDKERVRVIRPEATNMERHVTVDDKPFDTFPYGLLKGLSHLRGLK